MARISLEKLCMYGGLAILQCKTQISKAQILERREKEWKKVWKKKWKKKWMKKWMKRWMKKSEEHLQVAVDRKASCGT